MSSNIFFKFRSGTTYESLSLMGSAARLFEVKKAIVKAKKLDANNMMDFELIVTDAETKEEYTDETQHLRKGRSLIIARMPAKPGHGFLARMARQEQGGGIAAPPAHLGQPPSVPSGYYTIDGRAREEEEEEFVDTADDSAEDKELAALQAVTSVQHQGPVMAGGGGGGPRRGPPPPAGMGGPPKHHSRPPGANFHTRPNADPELREQEVKEPKRLTGIPRTFMSLSAPPQTEGANDGEDGGGATMGSLLQPNKRGFDELVKRKGGQSENTAGTRRDLDYALKLTSTSIPEHLQCAICGSLVKNAMLLPWDPEGRTVCETCIRDALTQNGFRCPLTGTEGVSPDDLIPNVGLRKAAELFLKGVMEKVDEIEQQQVEESSPATYEGGPSGDAEKNVVDGDGVEKGVITVSKKTSLSSRKKNEDDPFGEDDFGGDVFAAAIRKAKAAEGVIEAVESKEATKDDGAEEEAKDKQIESKADVSKDDKTPNEAKDNAPQAGTEDSKDPPSFRTTDDAGGSGSRLPSAEPHDSASPPKDDPAVGSGDSLSEKPHERTPGQSHRRAHRRRGPPVGYAMGLGGRGRGPPPNGSVGARPNDGEFQGPGSRGGGRGFSPRGDGGGRNGNFYPERGGGSFGRGDGGGHGRGDGGRGRGGRFHGDHPDDSSRGTKRSFDDQSLDGADRGPPPQHWDNPRFDDRGGRGGRGRFYHDGPPNGRGRGDFRGGRGRGRGWDGPGRGGGFRGGRGGRGFRGRGGRF